MGVYKASWVAGKERKREKVLKRKIETKRDVDELASLK